MSMCQCACVASGCSKPVPSPTPTAGGAPPQNTRIENHERQPPIALLWILEMEADDGLLLPIFEPEIPGNPTVVLVHTAIALPPVVELTGTQVEPSDEVPGADFRFLRPAPDEIDDLIAHVRRNPDAGQSSPRLFLGRHVPPSTPREPHP